MNPNWKPLAEREKREGKIEWYRAVAPVSIERRAVLGRDGKVEKVLETAIWR
jgi:hypothetical protein